MIDLTKLTNEELRRMSQIALDSVEKSELEKYYLFTSDALERAKIFINCYRIYFSLYNLIPLESATLRDMMDKDLKRLKLVYEEAELHVEKIPRTSFNKHRHRNRLLELLSDREVIGLIDIFSILLERQVQVQVERIKGFYLEGKSGEAYRKMFGEKATVSPEPTIEEEFTDESKDEEDSMFSLKKEEEPLSVPEK